MFSPIHKKGDGKDIAVILIGPPIVGELDSRDQQIDFPKGFRDLPWWRFRVRKSGSGEKKTGEKERTPPPKTVKRYRGIFWKKSGVRECVQKENPCKATWFFGYRL